VARRIRTFIDSGILIQAARGTDVLSSRALAVLDDPNRVFVTSDFVRLEVIPKPAFHGKQFEVEFYEAFFRSVGRTVKSSRTLVATAEAEAISSGLSAVDALHIAAARRAGCHELITTESPNKPMFRTTAIKVTSILPQA
jgi:hypothetical protein